MGDKPPRVEQEDLVVVIGPAPEQMQTVDLAASIQRRPYRLSNAFLRAVVQVDPVVAKFLIFLKTDKTFIGTAYRGVNALTDTVPETGTEEYWLAPWGPTNQKFRIRLSCAATISSVKIRNSFNGCCTANV